MSNRNDVVPPLPAPPLADSPLERSAGVPALERALNVLEALGQSRKGYSVSELSRRLSLPKSSVHLILRTLERRGYLQKQASGGRYKFGMKLIALSRAALDGVDVREEARPALTALVQRTGLTAHLGVLEHNEVIIIDRLESSSPIRIVSWIGRRMDLTSTAMGRALLAHVSEPEVGALLGSRDEERVGSKTSLRKELDRVRQQGYAVCDEEGEFGVRSIAAPVLDAHGQAIAAISVAGTTLQIPPERLSELGLAVKSVALEIGQSAVTGYGLRVTS